MVYFSLIVLIAIVVRLVSSHAQRKANEAYRAILDREANDPTFTRRYPVSFDEGLRQCMELCDTERRSLADRIEFKIARFIYGRHTHHP